MIIINCPKCKGVGDIKVSRPGCYGEFLKTVACSTCDGLGQVKVSEDKLKEIK